MQVALQGLHNLEPSIRCGRDCYHNVSSLPRRMVQPERRPNPAKGGRDNGKNENCRPEEALQLHYVFLRITAIARNSTSKELSIGKSRPSACPVGRKSMQMWAHQQSPAG